LADIGRTVHTALGTGQTRLTANRCERRVARDRQETAAQPRRRVSGDAAIFV
jgi:hypothetical protein